MADTLTRSSWKPAGVVFDCDGLLVDTEPCWTVAETEVFARRGFGFGPEQKAMVIGRTLESAGEAMASAFGEPGQGPAIAAELLALVAVVIADCAEAMPGAREVVDDRLALGDRRRPAHGRRPHSEGHRLPRRPRRPRADRSRTAHLDQPLVTAPITLS
jgi:beta-phosphoglucomutase-like phosphatase (HAD superfamily)